MHISVQRNIFINYWLCQQQYLWLYQVSVISELLISFAAVHLSMEQKNSNYAKFEASIPCPWTLHSVGWYLFVDVSWQHIDPILKGPPVSEAFLLYCKLPGYTVQHARTPNVSSSTTIQNYKQHVKTQNYGSLCYQMASFSETTHHKFNL
jgi:hypothetical protein